MPFLDEDGVQKEMVVQLSKTFVDLAVTEYFMALQLPSQVAFAAVLCAVDYVAPISFANSLAYLRMISGLDTNDAEFRLVLDTVMGLVIRVFIPTEQDRLENAAEDDSVSSDSSPTCIAKARYL